MSRCLRAVREWPMSSPKDTLMVDPAGTFEHYGPNGTRSKSYDTGQDELPLACRRLHGLRARSSSPWPHPSPVHHEPPRHQVRDTASQDPSPAVEGISFETTACRSCCPGRRHTSTGGGSGHSQALLVPWW
jgi:hypothetical protein